MGRVIRTPPAEQDLDEIFDHIAGHEPRAAFRFLAAFDRKADLYAGNPLLGETWPDLGPDVRAFRIGRYVGLYRPIGAGIEVLRVFHSSRDIPRLFRGG